MDIDRKTLDKLAADIRRQADAAGPDGWTEIPVPPVVSPDGVIRVARGAFEHWATWRSGGEHLAKPWTRVSPQGVKQGQDDPLHTDWMLSANLHPQAMRDDLGVPGRADALTSAAYAARSEVERRLLGFDCSVLLPGAAVTGRCWHPSGPDDEVPRPDADGPPVAVLADARPDWLDLVARTFDAGGAVVVERGGGMAHLVTELRGSGKGPLVRMAKALRLYPEGSLLAVDPAQGRIALCDDGRAPQGFPQVEDVFPPEPAPFVPPPLGRNPGISRIVPGRPNPSHAFGYMRMDRSVTVEWPEHKAYATAHGHRPGLESMTRGSRSDPVALVIGIYGRDGRKVATWFAGESNYTFDEIKAVARKALAQHETPPDPNAYWDRLRREAQEREARLKAKLHALGEDELLEAWAEKVEEERSFLAEAEAGDWDYIDYRDITDDYREWFSQAEWVFVERGMAIPPRGEAAPSAPAP